MPIRKRILQRLHYLDFISDEQVSAAPAKAREPVLVSRIAHSKPVYVVPADEAAEMVRHMLSVSD